MDPSFVRSLGRRLAAAAISALALGSSALTAPAVVNPVAVHPLVSDWAYLGNFELAHALYTTNADGYFWHEIYRCFCFRDTSPTICCR